MSHLPQFRTQMIAPGGDIDELGHVSNVAYVRWIQEVATAHSGAVGWSHDAYQALGAIWVVRKHTVEYLKPALEGDPIELVTHVAGFRGATSERHTQIVRLTDGALLCRAVTLWAFISIESGRPRRIHPDVVAAFAAGSQAPDQAGV